MKKILLIIFLIIFNNAYSISQEMKKFIALTPKHAFGLDIHRLMIKTSEVESDGMPHFKKSHAVGLMQIEPSSFNAMIRDKRMTRIISYNNKHYQTNINNYDNDTYANIVCAYTVYIWKIIDVSEKWIPRIKPRIKNNYDKEWLFYKVLYNSIAGKATYERWGREINDN